MHHGCGDDAPFRRSVCTIHAAEGHRFRRRIQENEEQFADSSFKNLSIRNSGCSILRWILLERLNLRKIQCALLRMLRYLLEILAQKKNWALVQ